MENRVGQKLQELFYKRVKFFSETRFNTLQSFASTPQCIPEFNPKIPPLLQTFLFP